MQKKNYFKDPKAFWFKYFNVADTKREINNIKNRKKGTPEGGIPFRHSSTYLNRMFQSKIQHSLMN